MRSDLIFITILILAGNLIDGSAFAGEAEKLGEKQITDLNCPCRTDNQVKQIREEDQKSPDGSGAPALPAT
jgi:hypothetical protein